MKYLSFKLTMPNVGSWNGKWTGAEKQYFIIKKVSDKWFFSEAEKLIGSFVSFQKMLEEKRRKNWHYNFGDGWSANIELEIVNSADARIRKKQSKGFCGYDWMVDSILNYGVILTTAQMQAKAEETIQMPNT